MNEMTSQVDKLVEKLKTQVIIQMFTDRFMVTIRKLFGDN